MSALRARSEAATVEQDGARIAVELLREHAGSFLATARRYSLCADDAHDAYQRATEILLRRATSLEPATRAAWMRSVVKHEALAVRAERSRHVSAGEPLLDETPSIGPDAEERAVRFDRLSRAAEALRRLKPQEVRALLLKAEGHSYQEICEITGWTYTKVNRCLTEGRRAFRRRFELIESGAECERWEATLSAMADGEAAPADIVAVRPHLRACPACRATLRDFHAAPAGLAALVPAGALAAPAAALATGRSRVPGLGGLVARLHEAAVGSAPVKVQAALDAASGGKMAAVAASTVALAGGGIAAVDSNVRRAVLAQHVAHPAKVAHVVDGRARPKPPPAAGPTRPVVDRSVVRLGATTTTAAARPVAVAKPKPKPAAPQEFTAPKPAPVPASAPQEFTSSSIGPAGGHGQQLGVVGRVVLLGRAERVRALGLSARTPGGSRRCACAAGDRRP